MHQISTIYRQVQAEYTQSTAQKIGQAALCKYMRTYIYNRMLVDNKQSGQFIVRDSCNTCMLLYLTCSKCAI